METSAPEWPTIGTEPTFPGLPFGANCEAAGAGGQSGFVRVADNSPEGARELLETPYVDYFARLNATTAQLEPAAEIHWS